MDFLIDDLRRKFPGKGRAADYQRSRSAAIWLFCMDCMGEDRQAIAGCTVCRCPLWPFRPFASKKQREGRINVPPLGWYDSETAGAGNTAALERFRKENQSGGED